MQKYPGDVWECGVLRWGRQKTAIFRSKQVPESLTKPNLIIPYSCMHYAVCTDGYKYTHEHTLLPGVGVRENNCVWLGRKMTFAPGPGANDCAHQKHLISLKFGICDGNVVSKISEFIR